MCFKSGHLFDGVVFIENKNKTKKEKLEESVEDGDGGMECWLWVSENSGAGEGFGDPAGAPRPWPCVEEAHITTPENMTEQQRDWERRWIEGTTDQTEHLVETTCFLRCSGNDTMRFRQRWPISSRSRIVPMPSFVNPFGCSSFIMRIVAGKLCFRLSIPDN
ncbi:hypothetical protein KIN20_001035 [Parelaphostrongylus tenuis]|uniref:Uncharacterized protein n=1 Tax=Parelaphostrongylus tenuis TaxID=148309 RepID=A0AAD5LVK2_PARTN|nr:hypothetical protein KIN20_001035 [Parelaphostrongylus tenuis]